MLQKKTRNSKLSRKVRKRYDQYRAKVNHVRSTSIQNTNIYIIEVGIYKIRKYKERKIKIKIRAINPNSAGGGLLHPSRMTNKLLELP